MVAAYFVCHRPNFSDIFDLCFHWVSVVRGLECTEKGGKFEFSAQAQDMAPFDANVTKVKIPFEIKPPLVIQK